MADPELPTAKPDPKNKFVEFWKEHSKLIQYTGAILGFVFISIPGLVNAVTGIPFAEWLKDQGINMPFISILFWGIGIAISVFIFSREMRLVRESGYKFSGLPWIYVAGLMFLILFNGLHKPLPKIVTLTSTNTITNFVEHPQWYLRITDIEVLSSGGGNPIDPKDVRFRINPIVNGQRYSTPTQKIFAHTGDQWGNESFPLPVGFEQYQIQFDGLTYRGSNAEPGNLHAPSPKTFSVGQLPQVDQVCDIQVQDNIDPGRRVATKIEITYDIVADQSYKSSSPYSPTFQESVKRNAQWYVVVRGTRIITRMPGQITNEDISYRIMLSANGQKYSYPSDYLTIHQEDAPQEQFPIVGDPPFRINFEGELIRQEDASSLSMLPKQSPMQEVSPRMFALNSLPATNQLNSIVVNDSENAIRERTSIEIRYDIVTNISQ